ncbi:hypothetical protein [Deinococcus xianganensis]|uniref:Uncharacterized protein n=1 Tax=Deinococcus xianganensis TaxID=1507289 RepID=A0A6I4YNL5_9DEIO|nr:hypothetical protein [Deinococcus xianganensis]MXV22010.1 hypothetical protein [Deinococcus xianganensis]
MEALEVKCGATCSALPGALAVPGASPERQSGDFEFFWAYTSGTLMSGATATTRVTYSCRPQRHVPLRRVHDRDRAGTLTRTVAFSWERSQTHLYLGDRSDTRQ